MLTKINTQTIVISNKNNIFAYDMERQELELITFKSFLNTLKKNNLYPIFRANIDRDCKCSTTRLYKVVFACDTEHVFCNASTIEEMLSIIDSVLFKRRRLPLESVHDQQMFICHIANMLLHEFVEWFVHDSRKKKKYSLDDMCKNIFMDACKTIYGDDFENLIEKEVNAKPNNVANLDTRQFMDLAKRMGLSKEELYALFSKLQGDAAPFSVSHGDMAMEAPKEEKRQETVPWHGAYDNDEEWPSIALREPWQYEEDVLDYDDFPF